MDRTRAQESTNAIERLYVNMRHLFNRGFYKPMGVSGESLRKSLLQLRPEIYGSIGEDRVELNGLTYVIDRLPEGIEECQFINLISDEGLNKAHFKPIIPPKRRRNCYRIDRDQMNIEITRGRSEIYDILTHLTFLFIESHKIANRVVINKSGKKSREWKLLEDLVLNKRSLTQKEQEINIAHLADILGRTFDETLEAYTSFSSKTNPNRFFEIIFWLGQLAIHELLDDEKRVIKFSSVLSDQIGHHIYGESWANRIKETILDAGLGNRPIHIISANMHSVMNSLYAPLVFETDFHKDGMRFYEKLSKPESDNLRKQVKQYAAKNGLIYLRDESGTNINVQIIDSSKLDFEDKPQENAPVIIVMDYAFGEQAYETMDELLKPFKTERGKEFMNVCSVSIMGKAGILTGGKGDIMIPSAHVFEGTADNYPFVNELQIDDFAEFDLGVYDGAMVTVLGTSLQNKEILKFFHESTWDVVGLEMEGAHYQKAIQAASKIRGNIREDVKVRYAYYASDNPLETGSTLASGGLGTTGVTPTYAITQKILEQIFK
jgi:hypothetical protein